MFSPPVFKHTHTHTHVLHDSDFIYCQRPLTQLNTAKETPLQETLLQALWSHMAAERKEIKRRMKLFIILISWTAKVLYNCGVKEILTICLVCIAI